MSEKLSHIFKDLRHSSGSDESARVYTCTTVHTGETEVIIEKTITERLPVQELEKALRKYEALTGGGGRRCITIDDLVDFSWKRK